MCTYNNTPHVACGVCVVPCVLCGALASIPHAHQLTQQLAQGVRVSLTQANEGATLQRFEGVTSRRKQSVVLNIPAVVLMMHGTIHHVRVAKGHERDGILDGVVSYGIGVDVVAVVRGRDVLHDVPLSASLAYNTIMPLSWAFVLRQYRCV